jgi:hypothetical protein
MVQLQQQPIPAELPRVVRIYRSARWPGASAGLALFFLVFVLVLAPHAHGLRLWIAISVILTISGLTLIGWGLLLLVRLPIIEASELGIAIWFHGPYRRAFFVPWNRVRAVVLTRVRPAASGRGASVRNALGIELIRDGQFPRPPESARRETPVDGAAAADLAWSSRSIGGDVRRWARLLQQMKLVYADPNR